MRRKKHNEGSRFSTKRAYCSTTSSSTSTSMSSSRYQGHCSVQLCRTYERSRRAMIASQCADRGASACSRSASRAHCKALWQVLFFRYELGAQSKAPGVSRLRIFSSPAMWYIPFAVLTEARCYVTPRTGKRECVFRLFSFYFRAIPKRHKDTRMLSSAWHRLVCPSYAAVLSHGYPRTFVIDFEINAETSSFRVFPFIFFIIFVPSSNFRTCYPERVAKRKNIQLK